MHFARTDVISTAGRNLKPVNSSECIRISPFGRNDNMCALHGIIEILRNMRNLRTNYKC